MPYYNERGEEMTWDEQEENRKAWCEENGEEYEYETEEAHDARMERIAAIQDDYEYHDDDTADNSRPGDEDCEGNDPWDHYEEVDAETKEARYQASCEAAEGEEDLDF